MTYGRDKLSSLITKHKISLTFTKPLGGQEGLLSGHLFRYGNEGIESGRLLDPLKRRLYKFHRRQLTILQQSVNTADGLIEKR